MTIPTINNKILKIRMKRLQKITLKITIFAVIIFTAQTVCFGWIPAVQAAATEKEQGAFYQRALDSVTGATNSTISGVKEWFSSYEDKVYNAPTGTNAPVNTPPNNTTSTPLSPTSTLNNSSTANSTAQPQYIPSWTDTWNKKVDSAFKDPTTLNDPNFQTQVELDKEYTQYVSPSLNQYMAASKTKQDELTQAVRDKARQENGAEESPYYIEPNQFRKICDQNTYVLYSRVGGAANRDLRNPTQAGGLATGEFSVWKVPTCEQLAQCDCCINTCDDVVLENNKPVCAPNVGFGPMGCSSLCKAPLARGMCTAFTGPSHPAQNDRDCMGRPIGCVAAAGCKIIIKDPNGTQFEYEKSAGSGVYVKSQKGDNVIPPGAKVRKSNAANALPQGWIGQLNPAAGQCCKCIQGQ
jgi:hypothetical protein